jgi:hypothetical protein
MVLEDGVMNENAKKVANDIAAMPFRGLAMAFDAFAMYCDMVRNGASMARQMAEVAADTFDDLGVKSEKITRETERS